jgi:hypothetical protein
MIFRNRVSEYKKLLLMHSRIFVLYDFELEEIVPEPFTRICVQYSTVLFIIIYSKISFSCRVNSWHFSVQKSVYRSSRSSGNIYIYICKCLAVITNTLAAIFSKPSLFVFIPPALLVLIRIVL